MINVIGTYVGKKISRGFDGTFTDGTETWRLIADATESFNWQYTLTSTGFNGTENTDYYTPQEIV
jgi:hypothetical protein